MDDERKNKFDYLDEHLPYLLKMLRHNLTKMQTPQHYLDWNSHFESFATNARNLKKFLTNGDNGNFNAKDFAPGFRARIEELSKPMTLLEEQVFHLDKQRPRKPDEKFDLSHAVAVADWVENEMRKFIAALSDGDRKMWNERKADPNHDWASNGTTGPTGPSGPALNSACTAAPITQTVSTTSGPGSFVIVGLTKSGNGN